MEGAAPDLRPIAVKTAQWAQHWSWWPTVQRTLCRDPSGASDCTSLNTGSGMTSLGPRAFGAGSPGPEAPGGLPREIMDKVRDVVGVVMQVVRPAPRVEGEGVDQGLAAPRGGAVTAELAGAQGTGGPQQRYEKKLKINVKQ